MSRFDEDPVFEVVSDPSDDDDELSSVIGEDVARRVDEYLRHPETGVRLERSARDGE